MFGLHCRKIGLYIPYRGSEPFQCILKARCPHNCSSEHIDCLRSSLASNRAKQVQRICHDTLPWFISFLLDLRRDRVKAVVVKPYERPYENPLAIPAEAIGLRMSAAAAIRCACTSGVAS